LRSTDGDFFALQDDPNAITSKIIMIPALVLIASDQLDDSDIRPSANKQQPVI
jgi:hypothetical protein